MASGSAGGAVTSTPASTSAAFRHRALPWLLVAPQLLIVGVFFFWPAGQALLQSLQQQDAFGASREWVGLANFAQVLGDPAYLATVGRTAFFAGVVTALGLAFSLALAVCTERVGRAAAAYRTLLIAPYAVAPVVAGVLWLFLFSPGMGLLARGLDHWGVAWNPRLVGRDAMLLVVLAAVWKQSAYNVVFFVAGLQAVPRSLLEAAAIDGAGPFRRFLTITWPLLAPTTFFLLVVNTVYAMFETFAIIDATTQGGPGQDTTILVYQAYVDGIKSLDTGRSAAQSVVLMLLVTGLTVLQFRFIERRVAYR